MHKLVLAALVLNLIACGERSIEQGATIVQPKAFSIYTLTNDRSTVCFSISSKLHPSLLDGAISMRFDDLDDLDDFSEPGKELRFGRHIATIFLHPNEIQRAQAIFGLSAIEKQPVREDPQFLYIFPIVWRGGYVLDKDSAMTIRLYSTPSEINLSQEKLRNVMLAITKMRVPCTSGAT
ncbi:hypothetical protein INQ41_12965 [Lysobacter ciconiae]|uniref:Uncharacterized protein n=1 Tax=Novilysobacter ciconiae TaxID=2781022 RepID=A0A7S6UFS5_9GAMM|nr:hypothetical protein [Lysobacter ciconiae]QOW19497.1 hypothetical protein INQ41_12965 [Lysobacter ciconiae]